jgi:hypothetical protein
LKHIKSNDSGLAIFRAFGDFARSHGVGLHDEATRDDFLAQVARDVVDQRNRPTVVYGYRTQSMFAYVAASLGGCTAIVEEDSGDFFASNPQLLRPDFRVLTTRGKQYFVEVKNFHQGDAKTPFRIKQDYIARLRAYAKLFSLPLRVAIYWSQWGLWTLVGEDAFVTSGAHLIVDLPRAYQHDEMVVLGDELIGIPYPLAFRVYTDPTKPRAVRVGEPFEITIQRCAMVVREHEILDALERKLAIYFMMYGTWDENDEPMHVENGEAIYFDFQVGSASARDAGEQFAIVGSLSQLASRQYREHTANNEAVQQLRPDIEPARLGIRIPAGYAGKVLKMCRLRIQPPNWVGSVETAG